MGKYKQIDIERYNQFAAQCQKEANLMNTQDNNWTEVMKLAEKYGFITMAYGGVSVLMSHEGQKKQGIYEKTQLMNGKKT